MVENNDRLVWHKVLSKEELPDGRVKPVTFTQWVRTLRGAEHALLSAWLRYTEKLRNPASAFGPGRNVPVRP